MSSALATVAGFALISHPAVVGGVLAVVLVLVVVVAWQQRQIRSLTTRAETEHARHVDTSVASHPKKPQARRVGLVINVTKDQAEHTVGLVHTACARAGLSAPLVIPSSAEDPGHSMTRQALEAGCDVVLAAGGDGTVRAVAAELSGTEVPLGVIPLGTGNLFARNIGLDYQDLRACVDEAVHGTSHRVDTLELVIERPGGRTEQEISLVIAGGGLDAEVMQDTREALKQRAGWLAYGEAGIRHLAGARQSVTVQLDGGTPHSFKVRSVIVANCGTLQAGMVLVPTARFDDGHVDTVLFTPRHALDWARIIAKTVLRFSADIPVMTVRQSRAARISMHEPMPFQIDGDAVGEVTGVSVAVAPGSLVVNGVSPAVLNQPQNRP